MLTFPLNLDADPHYLPFLSPAFNPGGGSALDDDDNPVDDDEDDDDDEEDDEPKPKGKGKNDDEDDEGNDPADLPDNVKAILRKNRLSARKAKADLKKAQDALDAATRGKGNKSDDDEDDDKERELEAEKRGSKRGLDIAKKASVRGALIGAGLTTGDDRDKALARAMRLIDFDNLEVEDDGTIDGLDDDFDDLKDEFPALFRKKRNPGRIGGQDDRGSGRGREKTMTASEIQAAQLTGRK